MRGIVKPNPVYTQDISGLLAWLTQPPSQWSAVGWQNAPAWAALVDAMISDLRDAEAERDEARREVCMDLQLPMEEARMRGWDCFAASQANATDVPVQNGGA